MDRHPLRIPEGVNVFAHFCGGVWPVIAKGYCTLSFQRGIIYPNDELIVEGGKGKFEQAMAFKTELTLLGFRNVRVTDPVLESVYPDIRFLEREYQNLQSSDGAPVG